MARTPLTALLLGAAAAALQPVAPLCISTVPSEFAGGGGIWEFDNVNEGSELNYTNISEEVRAKTVEAVTKAPAHFFQDVVWLDPKEKGAKHYRATKVVDGATFNGLIKQEMDTRGAKHALLYVHGFTNTPKEVFEIVDGMNKHLEKSEAFMIPMVWPSKQGLLKAYAKQKDFVKYIARGVMELLRDVEFEMPISIVSHSMGNYFVSEWGLAESIKQRGDQILGKLTPPPKFKVDNIFMVAADVKATIFEEGSGFEDGSFVGVPGIVKEGGKVHVLFNWWDAALWLRRIHRVNEGRAALGQASYDESKISDKVAGMLVKQDFSGFGLRFKGGHGYQKSRKALDYYLAHLS
mmetsp:Transcript_18837/g.55994  ORF Transcript_18837/g.55994 Transcript_18837/m.55994 type:complete len:350 (+) Transcript_18837:41-1090(+)